MRTHNLLYICVVLAFLLTSTEAQTAKPEFVSGVARFAIRINTSPSETKTSYVELPKYWLPGEHFLWISKSDYVSVSHYTPLALSTTSGRFGGLTSASKAEILSTFRDDFQKGFKKDDAVVLEVPFVIGTFKGIEFRVSGQSRSVIRLFFVKDRFYSLVAMGREAADFESQRKVLDSFRHLEKDEFINAILIDHMPPDLPQTIPNGIVPTDSIEIGLKGRVKKIVEEIESGKPLARHRSGEEHFNQLGFLTKKVTYSVGFPDTVSTYGWIDGNRATNLGPIKYRAGDGPASWQSRMTVGSAAPEGANVIGRAPDGQIFDHRYTTRFETIYDDQWRLKERRHLSTSGNANYVEKFNYTALGREILTVDDNGGFISGKFEVLDKEENVIEERSLNNLGKAIGTLVIKHEFDAKGNWIVKKTFRKTGINGRTLVAADIFYRRIEYYAEG